jgi:hypothetical protein
LRLKTLTANRLDDATQDRTPQAVKYARYIDATDCGSMIGAAAELRSAQLPGKMHPSPMNGLVELWI